MKKGETKYIFVLGGVLSGVGKGITAASIGAILQAKGLKVSIQKCEPYLNVDADTISPAEHGECFVTHDGALTDLDLGHYERFLDIETNQNSTTLAGELLQELIAKERIGGFNGQTVQLTPHLTDMIQDSIERAGQGSDVHICEIGGTVGDYESLSFIEAIRLFSNRVGRQNVLYTAVVYVPWLDISKEFKTKPAQNALKDMRSFGIIPDIVGVRTHKPAPKSVGDKIAKFSGVNSDAVVLLPDIKSVYDVPLNVLKSGILSVLNDFTNNNIVPDMKDWHSLSTARAKEYGQTVKVGMVTQYPGNESAYLSAVEALKAAACANKVNLSISWIDAREAGAFGIEAVDGVLVPGGKSDHSTEGVVALAKSALIADKPYLGLCWGMQIAAIAAAGLGCGCTTGSEESGQRFNKVVSRLKIKPDKPKPSGVVRLGNHQSTLIEGSKTAKAYGRLQVTERYGCSYEVDSAFLHWINAGGLQVSGTSSDGEIIDFMESPVNRFYVATQGHPEFNSRPMRPHPLFVEFIRALK